MGLGLSSYIVYFIFYGGLIAALLSIILNPKIGILFLFPLLPYQNVFDRLHAFPGGKDLNDIVILSVFVGWLLRKSKKDTNDSPPPEKSELTLPVFLLCVVIMIGFFNALSQSGSEFRAKLILDWKNYLTLPMLWFLTFKNIKDRKTILILTVLLVIGFFGADFYFYRNLRWMNVAHYSEKARHMMTGLFVYLGANHYGAFFAHFIFMLIGLFLFDTSKIRKALLLIVIGLTTYCIIYTFSRGAYLALLAGLFFIGVAKEKKLLIVLVVFLIAWKSFVPVSVVERIEMTKTEEGTLESSAARRVDLWEQGIAMFSESPLIGSGLNVFQLRTGWDSHNFYVKLLAELGIVGLGAFLLLLFKAFFVSWRVFRQGKDWLYKGLGLGFAATVISCMVTNVFGDRWSFLPLGAYFWIFLGIVSRAGVLIKESDPERVMLWKNKNAIENILPQP